MDVGFPPVFLVHVLECGMIVFVAVGGQQMAPVLSLMQIVRDVIMLVSVLQGFVLVMTLRTSCSPLPFRTAARARSRRYTGRFKATKQIL